MKQAIAFLLLFPFFIYFMFQPLLNHVVHLEQIAIEIVLDQGIEKAAVEGQFTPEIINEMKTTISNVLHFEQNEIVFTGTESLTPRGWYIEGQISLPEGQWRVLPGLFPGGDNIRFSTHATQMSEYVNR